MCKADLPLDADDFNIAAEHTLTLAVDNRLAHVLDGAQEDARRRVARHYRKLDVQSASDRVQVVSWSSALRGAIRRLAISDLHLHISHNPAIGQW